MPFLLLMVVCVAGCGGSWSVIKQAAPNPFTPDGTFAVAPPTFENLRVGDKSEAEWLTEKDEKARMIHEGDKQSYGNAFVTAMNAHKKSLKIVAEGARFTVKSHLYWMEPGYYAMVSHAPARVKVRVDVADEKGTVVDQVEFTGQGAAIEPFNPVPRGTVGERLRECADEVAAKVSRYLRQRAGLEK
jgi:hypothetical protein